MAGSSKDKGIPSGYELKTHKLPKKMSAAVSFVTESLSESDDESFANLININKTSELPPYFRNIIHKKILWEYFKKYGNLKSHVFNYNTVDLSDVVKPIERKEFNKFEQFCKNN